MNRKQGRALVDDSSFAQRFGKHPRLRSIEAFHLFSSVEPWPNCVTSRHRFQGTIDIELAKQAWQHCVARQHHSTWPIQGRSRKTWNTSPESRKPIGEVAEQSFREVLVDHWPENEADTELPNFNERGLPQIDVESGTGFGLWCIHSRSDDRVTLLFVAHHTLADGVAAIAFVRQWMSAYHNLCQNEPIDRGLPKLDWERWKSRSKLGLLKWSFLKFLPCQVIGLFGASKFIFRKFSTLEPAPTDAIRNNVSAPGIAGRTFSPQIVAELKDRSQRLNVSTNSLLMTILFRALEHVKQQVSVGDFQHCQWAERKWIRLILPIATRGLADRKLPLANKSSIVQIERTFDQVRDADGAAQSLEREIRIIIGFKLEQIFLILIRAASLFPWLLRKVSTNSKSRGTAVFTNLGEPFRKTRSCNFRQLGDLKLVDFDLWGPIRSGTPLNVIWSLSRQDPSAVDSADEGKAILGRLSVHFDRALLSPQEADIVLDAFERELVEVTHFGG